MNLQYISDNTGKTTGVFIPISEWNELKKKYKDIEDFNIPAEHLAEVRERLEEYRSQTGQALDFDSTVSEIERDL